VIFFTTGRGPVSMQVHFLDVFFNPDGGKIARRYD
jgi:hypothetical protein